jgi:hypothetical protein
MAKIEGKHELEINYVDDRKFLNFWDWAHGNDVCCQIIDGNIYRLVHSPMDVEADEIKDEPEIEDVFEKVEISFSTFLELVEQSILSRKI